MGLYKRGAVWWMSFTHRGRQYRQSTETEDRKLAIRIFDKLKGEIAEGKWFEAPQVEAYTFKELTDKYLTEYSAVNKAASSQRRDKSLFDRLNKTFGRYDVAEITPAMISNYKVQRRGEGVSARTINYELTVMSHVFTIAMTEWQLAVDNPVKRVRKERLKNRLERWLTPEEEAQLLKASPLWIRDIIVFAINTGMRQSEILDLKWGQIDMERRTLTISEQKNRSVDTLPLNGNAMKILATRYREGVKADRYVFPNGCRHRIVASNLMRAYRQAVKASGIAKARFHDLRHTFASRLVQNGADLFAVQKLGRWKNTSMVMRYAHHYTESLRTTIEMMDGGKPQIITNLSQSPKKRISRPRLRLVSG